MERFKKIGAVIFIGLLLLTGFTNTIKGGVVEEAPELSPLKDGRFFVVYNNVRNYDAYGYLFDEKGEVVSKAFLGQGFTDTGDLSAFGDGLLLVNPEQNESLKIDQGGTIEKVTLEESSLLNKERRFTFVSGDYLINVPDRVGGQFLPEEPLPDVNETQGIIVEKNGERKAIDVQGKWIEAAFMRDGDLYLVIAKAGYEEPFYLESYDLKEGILKESQPIPLEGMNKLSSARYFVSGDRLVIGDGAKVISYDLAAKKVSGTWPIPEERVFKRLSFAGDSFYVFTTTTGEDKMTGTLYQVGLDGKELKQTDLQTAGAEKHIYELADAFVSQGRIYAFCSGIKEPEQEEPQGFSAFLFLMGSLFGIYNGPVDSQAVYVYDLESGLLVEKIKLNVNDSKLENGVMLPWMIEKSEETNLW